MQSIVRKAVRPFMVVLKGIILSLIICATGGAWAMLSPGDTVPGLSNTGTSSDVSSEVYYECHFDFCIPATADLPAGSIVKIKSITLASINNGSFVNYNGTNHNSDPGYINLNGVKSGSVNGVTFSNNNYTGTFTDKIASSDTQEDYALKYTFSDSAPCKIIVGKQYPAPTGSSTGAVGYGISCLHPNGNCCYGSSTDQIGIRYVKTQNSNSVLIPYASQTTDSSGKGNGKAAKETGYYPVYSIEAEVVEIPSPGTSSSPDLVWNASVSYEYAFRVSTSRWFTKPDTPSKMRVGPNTTDYVYNYDTPYWQNVGNQFSAGFSFVFYCDVSQVPSTSTSKGVMLCCGNSGSNHCLLYREGTSIKVALFNSSGTMLGTAASVADVTTPGYRLVMFTCNPSTGSLSLYVGGDDGVLKSNIGGYETETQVSIGTQFQLGSIHGGNRTGFAAGSPGLVFQKMMAYVDVLTAEDAASLLAAYPRTDGSVITSDIDPAYPNKTLTVYTSTASGNQYLGGTKGTVTIATNNTVTVPYLRVKNSSDNVIFTMNIAGTVVATAESSQADVYSAQFSGKKEGILFGHYNGTTKVNITGSLIGEKAYMSPGYTSSTTVNISGGRVKVRGMYLYPGKSGTVVLADGGVLEVSQVMNEGGTITRNFGYGTYKANGSFTDNRAITFNAVSGYATTLDPNGNTMTLGASAVTGTGNIKVQSSADASAPGVVVFNSIPSTYTGNITIASGSKAKLVAGNYTSTFTVEDGATLEIDPGENVTYACAASFAGAGDVVVKSGTCSFSGSNALSKGIQIDDGAVMTATTGEEGKVSVLSGGTLKLTVASDDEIWYDGYVAAEVTSAGTVEYYDVGGTKIEDGVYPDPTSSEPTSGHFNGVSLLPYYYVWDSTRATTGSKALSNTDLWRGGSVPADSKNVAIYVSGMVSLDVDVAKTFGEIQIYGSGSLTISGNSTLTAFKMNVGVSTLVSGQAIDIADTIRNNAGLALAGTFECNATVTGNAPMYVGDSTLAGATVTTVTFKKLNADFTGGLYVMNKAVAKSAASALDSTSETGSGFGPTGGSITVYTGGQLDLANTQSICYNITIDQGVESDTPAITNTGSNIGNTARQTQSLTVNANATIATPYTWGVLASGYAQAPLTLKKGITLTKTGAATFLIASALIKNTGEGETPKIVVAEGTLEAVNGYQGAASNSTLDTGASLAVEIEDDATFNVDKGFQATSLDVSGNGTVNVSSSGALTLAAVAGSGTINWTGKQPDGSVWSTSAGWTGTNVVISATGLTDMNPANWGNASSFIKLNGVAGYFVQANVEATAKKTILEDNGANAALQISNGYQGYSVTFRKIAGDGTIADTHNHTTAWHMLIFKDATEFTGSIKATQTSGCKKFVFSDAGTGTASETGLEGRLVVQSDGHAVIGAGKEWKPASSIHIAGEVKLLGAATMSKPVTINGTTAKLVLADSALTINNTLTFADGAKLTIDPGAIDLTAKTSLITGLTAEPDVAGITVENCNVTTGQADGKYVVYAAYKDTAWSGESGDWTESSFNGGTLATDGEDISFVAGANGAVAVTLTGTRAPANVVFNGGSTSTYTLTGGTFSPSETVTVENGSVTIESAATGTYVVKDGATLSLTNATVTSVSGAGTLNIPAGGVITLASATAIDGISSLTGSGKLVMPSAGVPGTSLQTLLQKGADWQGTILIHNKTGWTDINPNLYGNTASKVEFQGIDGYFANPSSVHTINPEIIFSNGSYDYAYKHSTDAYSYDNNHPGNYTVFSKVSGTGSLNSSLSNEKHPMFVFVDATGFSGSILHSSGGASAIYLFTDSEALPNASAYDSTLVNGTINVWASGTAVIGDGNMWRSGSQGMKVQGTLQIEGAATLAFAYNAITFKNGTTVRFMNPASDKCLTIASDTLGTLKALTVAAGDTVNIAFGDGVVLGTEPGTEMQLISWGGAPEGDFEFADVSTPKCYRLEKRENGLYLVVKPGTIFSVY